MKFIQLLIPIILPALLISGCYSTAKNNTDSSPLDSKTTNILISNESDFDSAIKDFAANNYKDWEIKTIEDLNQCRSNAKDEPCDTGVKITNKNEEKLIVLTIREVEKANANPSYVVFEKK